MPIINSGYGNPATMFSPYGGAGGYGYSPMPSTNAGNGYMPVTQSWPQPAGTYYQTAFNAPTAPVSFPFPTPGTPNRGEAASNAGRVDETRPSDTFYAKTALQPEKAESSGSGARVPTLNPMYWLGYWGKSALTGLNSGIKAASSGKSGKVQTAS